LSFVRSSFVVDGGGARREEKAHQITEYSPPKKQKRDVFLIKKNILNTYRHDAGEGRRGERQSGVRRLSLGRFERISFLGGHFVFGCTFLRRVSVKNSFAFSTKKSDVESAAFFF
jgi:hypothetical protein